ncbi:MAG: hypothetical protein WCJ29_05800 [bacterium]
MDKNIRALILIPVLAALALSAALFVVSVRMNSVVKVAKKNMPPPADITFKLGEKFTLKNGQGATLENYPYVRVVLVSFDETSSYYSRLLPFGYIPRFEVSVKDEGGLIDGKYRTRQSLFVADAVFPEASGGALKLLEDAYSSDTEAVLIVNHQAMVCENITDEEARDQCWTRLAMDEARFDPAARVYCENIVNDSSTKSWCESYAVSRQAVEAVDYRLCFSINGEIFHKGQCVESVLGRLASTQPRVCSSEDNTDACNFMRAVTWKEGDVQTCAKIADPIVAYQCMFILTNSEASPSECCKMSGEARKTCEDVMVKGHGFALAKCKK